MSREIVTESAQGMSVHFYRMGWGPRELENQVKRHQGANPMHHSPRVSRSVIALVALAIIASTVSKVSADVVLDRVPGSHLTFP